MAPLLHAAVAALHQSSLPSHISWPQRPKAM